MVVVRCAHLVVGGGSWLSDGNMGVPVFYSVECTSKVTVHQPLVPIAQIDRIKRVYRNMRKNEWDSGTPEIGIVRRMCRSSLCELNGLEAGYLRELSPVQLGCGVIQKYMTRMTRKMSKIYKQASRSREKHERQSPRHRTDPRDTHAQTHTHTHLDSRQRAEDANGTPDESRRVVMANALLSQILKEVQTRHVQSGRQGTDTTGSRPVLSPRITPASPSPACRLAGRSPAAPSVA